MRIGIDFDNTIACYDGVFHRAAVERELVPEALGTDKNTVRNYLREIGKEDEWTKLQGYVYGARMDMVAVYEGFRNFVETARRADHELVIVSHKTKTPFMGPSYDLHAAAQSFLADQTLIGPGLVSNVYFELTLDEKVSRINQLECDVFVDDLPELLGHKGLSPKVVAYLFDPDEHFKDNIDVGRPVHRHGSWGEITQSLLV
ncbi:MAG: hypothetical protein RLN89_10345 [Parvibaculum sp.]